MYLDPLTNIPFYVGYGKGNRYMDHLNEVKKGYIGGNKHKYNKIKKLIDIGLSPIIKKVDIGLGKEQACELEEFLIKEIGRSDLKTGPLANMTMRRRRK